MRLWIAAAWVGAALVLVGAGAVRAAGDKADETLETIIRGVQHRNNSLSAGYGFTLMEILQENVAKDVSGPQVVRQYIYHWRYDGPLFFQEQLALRGENLSQKQRFITAWNGQDGTYYSAGTARVRASLGDIPPIDVTQLLDLNDAYYPTTADHLDHEARVDGEQMIGGFRTYHVRKSDGNTQYEWWVAPELNFLPLLEKRNNHEGVDEECAVLPMSPALSAKYNCRGPVVLPFIREVRAFGEVHGRRVLKSVWRLTLYDATLGKPPEAGSYSPDLPIGTSINDGVRDLGRYGIRPEVSAASSPSRAEQVWQMAAKEQLPCELGSVAN